MEQIIISINVGDFGDSGYTEKEEVVYLLRKLADRFEKGQEPTKVMDINGNSVGQVEYTMGE